MKLFTSTAKLKVRLELAQFFERNKNEIKYKIWHSMAQQLFCMHTCISSARNKTAADW